MPTNDSREDRRVHNTQVRDPMHPQERVHDPALLPRRHARRARRMVQRLRLPADALGHRGVVELVERVVQGGVVLARRVEHGRERLGVQDLREQAGGAHEHGDVVLCGQVPRVDDGRVVRVCGLEADGACARWPVVVVEVASVRGKAVYRRGRGWSQTDAIRT